MPHQKGRGRIPGVHSDNWGGARKGAGRGRTGPNKYQAATAKRFQAEGDQILQMMIATALDESQPLAVRFAAGREVLPFLKQRLPPARVPDKDDELDRMSAEQKLDRVNALVAQISRRRPEYFERVNGKSLEHKPDDGNA